MFLSEESLNEEINKAQGTLNEIKDYADELDKEISKINLTFEETYDTKQYDFSEIEAKLSTLKEQI